MQPNSASALDYSAWIPNHTFVAGACECGVAFGMTVRSEMMLCNELIGQPRDIKNDFRGNSGLFLSAVFKNKKPLRLKRLNASGQN